MRFNAPYDKVYVQDEIFGWLPGIVLQVECGTKNNDRALVCIELPEDWDDTTVLQQQNHDGKMPCFGYRELNGQQRWVFLNDYFNHRLPERCSNCIGDPLYRDVGDIPEVNEAEILYLLKTKYNRAHENPYIRLGKKVMISLSDPNECILHNNFYSLDQQRAYGVKAFGSTFQKGTKETIEVNDASSLASEPHIYEFSSLLYKNLLMESSSIDVSNINQRSNTVRRTQQSLIILGESGTGKTETAKIILQHFLSLPMLLHWNSECAAMKEDTLGNNIDLMYRITDSLQILEAFGNASTSLHSNSSRFATIVKIQYYLDDARNQRPKLVGTEVNTFMLETSRLSNQMAGERNFHIFYQMLASSEESKRVFLGPGWTDASYQDFRYLTCNDHVIDADCSGFEKTLEAMKLFCWDDMSLKMVTQALGIVLRLGNLSFDIDSNGCIIIRSQNDLVLLAQELGLETLDVESAFTCRHLDRSCEEICSVSLTLEDAIEARDSISKMIYAGIFSSIVRQINLLCGSPYASMHSKSMDIYVADLFGFQNLDCKQNTFQQFCVNYVHERLQQNYLQSLRLSFTNNLEEEGVDCCEWNDNASIVDLLEKEPNGIILLMDRQTCALDRSSLKFVHEIKSLNRHNDRLVNESGQSSTQFAVKHFMDTVLYDGSMFVQSNRLLLLPSVVNLGLNCSNRLISQEIGKATKGCFDFCSGNMIGMTASSSMKNHRKELDDFIGIISKSESFYVRCFKPNVISKMSVSNNVKVEHNVLLRQIKASSLVFTINLLKENFSHELNNGSFESKFSCLVDHDSRNSLKDMQVHDRVQIMLSILFSSFIQMYGESEFVMPFACGKTKVFFRDGALEFLESRRELLSMMAIKIQGWIKTKAKSRKGEAFVAKIIKVQSIARKRKEMLTYEIKQKYMSTSQTTSENGLNVICSSITMEEAVLEIQCWYRASTIKQRFKCMAKAAATLTRWWRNQTHRNLLFQKLWFATMIPVYMKAMKHLKCYDLKKHQKFIRTIQNVDSFHHKVPFKLVFDRFICLMPESAKIKMSGMTERDNIELMLSILFTPFIEGCRIQDRFPLLYPLPYFCGESRVYFRAGSLEVLEIVRREHFTVAAIELQRWARKESVMKTYTRTKRMVLNIQRLYRTRNATYTTLYVTAVLRALRKLGFCKPTYDAALTKAVRNRSMIFPYFLSYEVTNDRFASLISTSYKECLYEMDVSDQTKFILSLLFAPFIEEYKIKLLPMPFDCREGGVCLRVGSLEVLEILRKEKLYNSAIKIQTLARSRLLAHQFQTSRMGAIRLQAVFRRNRSRLAFTESKRSAVLIQQCVRRNVLHPIAEHKAAIVVNSAFRDFLKRKQSSRILTSWARSRLVAKKIDSTLRLVAAVSAQSLNKEPPSQVSDENLIYPKDSARRTTSHNEASMSALTKVFPNRSDTTSSDDIDTLSQGNSSSHRRRSRKSLRTEVGEALHSAHSLENNETTHMQHIAVVCLNKTMKPVFGELEKDGFSYLTQHPSSASCANLSPSSRDILVKNAHVKSSDRKSFAQACQPESVEPIADDALDGIFTSLMEVPPITSSFAIIEQEWTRPFTLNKTYTTIPFETEQLSRKTVVCETLSFGREPHLNKDRSELRNGPGCTTSRLDSERAESDDITSSFNNASHKENANVATMLPFKVLSPVEVEKAKVSTLEASDVKGSRLSVERERYLVAQVESLRKEITQITAEAEIHNQGIEAEYDERIAAYESEVLQLHHNIESLEADNVRLKKSNILTQERYDETVKNLKQAMKQNEESQRRYLEQVMASVEKSRLENAKTLETVKRRRDCRIGELEQIVSRQKNEHTVNTATIPTKTGDSALIQEVHRLALKLEKIVCSQHILKLSEKFRNEPSLSRKAIFDEKISYKARNIVGRMERMIVSAARGPQTINVIAEKELHQLEQQLVHAYEEIEMLEADLNAQRNKNAATQNRRRRKFF